MKTWFALSIIALVLVLSSFCAHQKTEQPSSAALYNSCIKQANDFLKQNDYEKAIEQLDKALEIKPNSKTAHNLLGITYFQTKNYAKAQLHFEKVISTDSSYAPAYNNLGSCYFMMKKNEKAKEMFMKSISLNPKLVSAYYSLGTLMIMQGLTEEAFTYLSKGIELDPEYLEKDTSFVTNLSSNTSDSAEIYFTYAKIFASEANIEKTVEYLKKAQKSGFQDWDRIEHEKAFENIKDDPLIKKFLEN